MPIARISSTPPMRGARPWRTFLFGSLGFAIALAVGIVVGRNHQPQPPIHYQLLGGVSQGELISAADQPARLLFNDASTIETGRETTLNVQVVEGNLVTRLVQGNLKVQMAPGSTADWRFVVGPHEVRPKTARFDLSWDPERSRLAVAMVEGGVTVHTPDQEPTRVTAGQVLILDESNEALHLANAADVVGDTTANPAFPPDSEDEESEVNTTPSWAQQVAAGRFEDIVRDAKQMGLKHALAQKSSADLVALAQAARYTRDGNLTLQAWTAIRERFAGQPASTQAAFFLARFYDQLGRSEDALTWFDTYLMEAPNGVYASESLGRKLILVRSLRGNDEAREQAGAYLARFPHGPHADTARDVLLND